MSRSPLFYSFLCLRCLILNLIPSSFLSTFVAYTPQKIDDDDCYDYHDGVDDDENGL